MHGVQKTKWQNRPGREGRHSNAIPYSRQSKHKNGYNSKEYISDRIIDLPSGGKIYI